MPDSKDHKDLVSAGLADQKELIRLVKLLRCVDPICVEVGAYIGRTANAMIVGGAKKVFSIDLWSGDHDKTSEKWQWKTDESAGLNVLKQYCENTPFLTHTFPLKGSSEFWAKNWPFKADLIFIDANHNYEFVKKDIELWYPHLKSGGVLCGHDYSDYCPGVKKAVDEIFGKRISIGGWSIWSLFKD